MLNWGMDAQTAINLPNFGALGAPTLLEDNRFPAGTLDWLRAHDHELTERTITS
ncbi:hypothetical protein [Zobellella denitrificans]|uniref:hypothetical protein n=1 Tax=Zobellella denitrificans TaxID=347534 RepID=UPI001C3D07BD|nr:hypothetical protein [Zobellella denitrificans]